MSLRKIGAGLSAALVLTAVMAGSALAAPTTVRSHWSVGTTTIAAPAELKCSLASEKLSLKANLGTPVWITATGAECLSGSTISNGISGNEEMAVDSERLKLTGVSVMEPAGCKVAEETITTESLTSNLEMEGESVYDKLSVPVGGKIGVVRLRECAAEGNYNLTGFVRGLWANKTREEKTNQKLKFSATASELELGGFSATLEAELDNELKSGGSFTASIAPMVPSHWKVNGATLTGSREVRCSLASEKLSLKFTYVGSPVWMTATGVECPTASTIENTTVEGVSVAADAGSLKLTGLTVMEPPGCLISGGTVTTVPLASFLEMHGESVYDKFGPASGANFFVLKIRECALEGTYNITGGFFLGLSANKTGEEKANQKLIFNAASNELGNLTFGTSPITLEGEINTELIAGGVFSAEK